MEIRKNKHNVKYRECIYINGRKINGPYFDRKTDAKEWKLRLLNERTKILIYGEILGAKVDVPFSEYADEWVEGYVKTNCSKKTYQSYKSVIEKHLKPRFGKLLLREVNESHGINLMNDLKKTHNAKGVINIWGVIKGIISKAIKEKIILNDPFQFINRPKQDLTLDNYWIREEINQFFNANINNQFQPLYWIAIHTGMRLAELCGLCWDRVNFSTNQISVTRTRDKYGLKDNTKTRIKRHIPMTNSVKQLLLRLKSTQQNSTYVFTERDGRPIDYGHVYRHFKKAQSNAQMKNQIRFHDLRHTFASNYIMNGGNIFELQKILGHTKIEMTMRYSHCSQDHLQGSVKFMDMAGPKNESIPNLSPEDFLVEGCSLISIS